MAEKRATFSLRRRTALGFSNCRRLRTTLSVPSRSTFFFSRRNARSTGSPFFSLISVNALTSFRGTGDNCHGQFPQKFRNAEHRFLAGEVNVDFKRRQPIHNLKRHLNLNPPVKPIMITSKSKLKKGL